ncbi:MAG: hypothetical protein ACYSR8_10235, partial [Planctomycetota bacterium]
MAVKTFQAAAVLILCLIVYTVWFFSGKAVIDTDYVARANEIVRPVSDESLNAASLYNQAVELYEKSVDDDMSELIGRRTKYDQFTA